MSSSFRRRRERRWVIGSEQLLSNKVFSDFHHLPGWHKREGILLARGEGFRGGAVVEGASIVDLAPTILYYLGLAIPTYMDGSVLGDLFTEDFLRGHAKVFVDAPSWAADSPPARDLSGGGRLLYQAA